MVVAAVFEAARPGLSAVRRFVHHGCHHVDGVRVVGIDHDPAVVVVTLADGAVGGLVPRLTAVVGAEDDVADGINGPRLARLDFTPPVVERNAWSIVVLDDRIEDVGITGIYRQTDLADQSGGQVVRQPGPRGPAVDRFVDAAARAGAREPPGPANPLVGRRVQNVGVARVHEDVGRADRHTVHGDAQGLAP